MRKNDFTKAELMPLKELYESMQENKGNWDQYNLYKDKILEVVSIKGYRHLCNNFAKLVNGMYIYLF